MGYSTHARQEGLTKAKVDIQKARSADELRLGQQ
jgi:hypothetical protein